MKVNWSQKTGFPFYDNFIDNPDYAKHKKGLDIQIIYLSPQKYLDYCALIFDQSPSAVRNGRLKENIDELAIAISKGNEIFIPFVDFAYNRQEGLHRALACEQLGIESIPVLFVDKNDKRNNT